MISEILIVEDITTVITNWGDLANNRIFQELAGHYWFVDIDPECDRAVKHTPETACESCEYDYEESVYCDYCDKVGVVTYECGDCTKCLHKLPLKIAWFILEAVRIQKRTLGLGIPPKNDDICQPILQSYIPAKHSKSGEVEEIPAELAVLHVKEV